MDFFRVFFSIISAELFFGFGTVEQTVVVVDFIHEIKENKIIVNKSCLLSGTLLNVNQNDKHFPFYMFLFPKVRSRVTFCDAKCFCLSC